MNVRERAARSIKRLVVIGVAIGLTGVLAGCAQLEQQQALQSIASEIDALKRQLAETESQAQSASDLELQTTAELNDKLTGVNRNIAALKQQVAKTCQVPTLQTNAQECSDATKTVVKSQGEKLILGEVEHVWLDPPGFEVVARVDSGASSSSLHAKGTTEFERDGEDWVRFEVEIDETTTVVERKVLRYVRVFQQADKNGTRRPVVDMRIKVGDVTDTFEFTLADRSHLEHDMILGRNFLTDIALVDVSQRFIQPSNKP